MNPSPALVDDFIPDIYEQVQNGLFYGIVRKPSPRSRSGLAIMKPIFNFPYMFPSMLIPKTRAKNFLDEVLRSRQFRGDIVRQIEKVIEEELRRG